MSVERVNPPTLYDSLQYGFSHGSIQPAGRVIHLAGQVAWDASCTLVGPGDLATQTRQALSNLKQVLAAVGVTPADVLRLRTYVVDHGPEKLEPVLGQFPDFYEGAVPAPNTFIGVQSLALPGILVEIEAIAALSD